MNEEAREQVIQNIVDWLRSEPFTFEFKVAKKPKGIKVIYEVTQEEMDVLIQNRRKNEKGRTIQ